MAQTNLNIRIDENVKIEFDKLCTELGLTMTACNQYVCKSNDKTTRNSF